MVLIPIIYCAESEKFTRDYGCEVQLDIPYGNGEREKIDIYTPKSAPTGIFIMLLCTTRYMYVNKRRAALFIL